jgi:hypothetical protein
MATFRLTGPDGATYRVTAPDGATPEQVYAMVNQHAGQPAAAPKPGGFDPDKLDATEGMGTFEKLAASAGAGMSDLALGAKQRLYGAVGTLSQQADVQEEVAEKRARDEKLISKTKGGGIARAVGNAAPLLVLPGGQRLGAKVFMGALGGAAGGALQPTAEGESSLLNTVIGGTIGGALPATLALLKAGYGAFTGKTAREAAERALAERAAAEGGQEAAQAAGTAAAAPAAAAAQAAPAAAQAARAAAPDAIPAHLGARPGPNGIPLSAAQQSGNTGLSQAEKVSRMRFPGAWREFDEQQARAIAESVQGATGAAEQLADRTSARGTAFREGLQGVLENADPGRMGTQRQALRQQLEEILQSPEGGIPGVRTAVEDVLARLDDLGEGYGAGHLQVARANLAGKTAPNMSGTPYANVPRDNPAIIRLTQQLDNALDDVSGGSWSPVRDAYRSASEGVRESQAARAVRDTFFDPATGTARKTAADMAGDVPEVTQQGLRTALDKTLNKRTGQTLLDNESHAVLQRTMEAVRARDHIQRLNKSATGGGGSATVPNSIALARELAGEEGLSALGNMGFGGRAAASVVRAVRGGASQRQAEQELALLQNPQAMQAVLAQAARQGGPAAREQMQQILIRLLRQGGTVGAAQSAVRPGTPETVE